MQWQYLGLKAISKFLCLFPYGVVRELGKGLTPLYSLIAKKQKKRAEENVIRAFQCSREEAKDIVDRAFSNLTQTMIEVFYMPKVKGDFINKYIEIEGMEYVEEVLAEDKGIIVVTAHMGNWEWMGASMAQLGYPVTTIVKNQPNVDFNRFLQEMRTQAGMEVFARDGADLIRAARAMKQKKFLGFLADQDGAEQGMPVSFLGEMSSAPMGPAIFAKRFRAPLLPMFITRTEKGHKIHILKPFYYEDAADEMEALYRVTAKCVSITEKFIHQHPTEWLWFQHRWRTKLTHIENVEEKLACAQKIGDIYEEK